MVLARDGLTLRERDERWLPDDLPWLGGVQTPWGLSLQLLNISTSGLLVESTSRFMPDSFSELYLMGLGRSIAVPARLVRSEVADVTSLGVKYRTAAVFDRKLDLVLEHHGLPSASLVTPRPLAALLKEVTDGPVSGGEAGKVRARFEQGLRQLVPACDIRIRAKPLAAAGGGETVFFTVPTRRSSPPVLQVTFEPDYKPAERELKLLKAAASVAAAVLESEGSPAPVGPVNAW
jgi:hypothetical protein